MKKFMQPFLIQDLSALRAKLERAHNQNSTMGHVWNAVCDRARAAPGKFPWFEPFVAIASGDERDLEAARQTIRAYVASLDATPFGGGLQFHYWCFAFPHMRWTLYFQWLDSIGAWDKAEAKRLRESLIEFAFTNFFFGLRVKPEPDCVDNQAMSLCLCNAMIGAMFGDQSDVAARMREDGLRRLPDMIGGMPASGYSGEGSTYMDVVVGPCLPFAVELLENLRGGDWFDRELGPNGGSAAAIARMIGREWMPGSLLLPWDHYGYNIPLRSTVAWAARRQPDANYAALLQRADWGHDAGFGWGRDDLVWSLVWWPEIADISEKRAFASWCEPTVGAALVSPDENLYLMQMWDETTPKMPSRQHVNPNALVLSAWQSPLTLDGSPNASCDAFNYDDTWKEVTNLSYETIRGNFGVGCAGGHSVILVDGWEGMRAMETYEQAHLVSYDENEVCADVTPIYREKWADARKIRRRSRLCENRFWLIEDLAVFGESHEFWARWFLRPESLETELGVAIETAEGVRLHLMPLLGSDEKTMKIIEGYPKDMDGRSLQVDFRARGETCRWLWLAWPDRTRVQLADIGDDWNFAADDESKLADSPTKLSLSAPPFLQGQSDVAARWWFEKTIELAPATRWLQLPRGLKEPRLWFDGQEQDLSAIEPLSQLMAPQLALPAGASALRVTLSCQGNRGQYDDPGDAQGGASFWGAPLLLGARDAATPRADYDGNVVTVRAGDETYRVAHSLMELG